jgi:hypothetical protein
VFGHVLNEREEAPLGVEPRVGLDLLGVWLEAFDNPAYAELEVLFGAVERANNQVDDA